MLQEIFNTMWTKITSAVIALLILILTTQYLGADGRGLVSLIYSSIGIIGIFAGFVGGPAVIYLASKKKMQYLIFPIYTWTIFIAICGAVVLWVLRLVPDIYILQTAILSITSFIFYMNLYLLIGHRKVRINNTIYLFQWIFNLIVLGCFFTVLNQPYVEYVVIALFVSNISGIALTFIELKKIAGLTPFQWSEEWEVIKSLVSFSFYAQAALIMYYLYFRLGIFLLNAYYGLSATGIYSVGVNIAEFILLASQSIALVAYSRISNTSDREFSKNITIRLAKTGLLITLGITIVILLIPSWIYLLIFGKDFVEVPGIVMCMGPGIVAFGFSVIILNYFSGIGNYKVTVVAAGLGLCATIVSGYLLIPVFGMYGAAIAASISYIVMSVVLLVFFMGETDSKVNDFWFRKTDYLILMERMRYLFSRNE